MKRKRRNKLKAILLLVMLVTSITVLSAPAVSAEPLSKAQVEKKVKDSSKEEVAGNIFIWFLCAVGFLKISQKIDSFMGSLGINVGQTGGNMLAEIAIAARAFANNRKPSSGSSGPDAGARSGFLAGGLAGTISRQFSRSAASAATEQGGNYFTRNAFQSSMAKGGAFANNVIGSVAKGGRGNGTITGDMANKALMSYMGLVGNKDAPTFSDVEIGNGRITGQENDKSFAMYSADQYMQPRGDFDTVSAADGSQWYRQYEQASVHRTPYESEPGRVSYHESIGSSMPQPPLRK